MTAGTVGPVPRPVETHLAPDSIFAPARDRMLHLARVYPTDRLLAVFRANAGLDTRGAEPPGNWEGFGHPEERAWSAADYPGREHAPTANLLRGHYAGHFLSMLGKAYAAEGEDALRANAWALAAGLAEVQAALAATGRYSHPGFLAAYGEWQFSRLEGYAPYGEIWAPWYTTHKIMAGLLDAHELTGSATALEVVTAMGHWAHGRLAVLPEEQRQAMWSLYIAGEFGGMNETLARLADVTGERTFLETAEFFDQQNLLEAGAAGRDVLDGMHANQHLPQLIGYVHEYRATGERRYLDTARALFDQVVPGRMYAHGGTGESELWGPAETVAGDIGPRNAETCAAYNLVRLARELLVETVEQSEDDSLGEDAERYADYIERALVNQVLGSRRAHDSDVSPEVTYMFPVHPGALREYDNVGTCCGGTGLENHVTHQDAVALEAGGDLWLVLLTDAVLDWSARGLALRVETDGPFADRVRIRIEQAPEAGVDAALQVHVPRWVRGDGNARVLPVGDVPAGTLFSDTEDVPAGTSQEPSEPLTPGTFHTLRRRWHTGDLVELQLPMALVATPTIDDPALYSLSYGPTLLLARSDRTTPLELPLEVLLDPDGTVRPRTGEDLPLRPSVDGTLELLGTTFEPCWSGADSRYHMYIRASDHEAHGDPGMIRIRTETAPSPSGWFTTVPTLRVNLAEELATRPAQVRIDDHEWTESAGPVTLPGDGRFRIEARVTDVGGTENSTVREVAVDTVAPTSRAVVKDLGSAVEITLLAEDDGSGVDRIQWEGPGTFWGTFHEAFVRTLDDQEQIIEFAATDRAGNQEERRRLVLPPRGA